MTGTRPSAPARAAVILGSAVALGAAAVLARSGTIAPLRWEVAGIALAIAAAAHLWPSAAPTPSTAADRPWAYWVALVVLTFVARIDVFSLGLLDDGDWALIFTSRIFTELYAAYGDGALAFIASAPIHLSHAGLSAVFLPLQSFFGAWAPPYHALSLAVAGLAACALFSLGRRITGDSRSAFLGAALFCVHPRLWEVAAVPSAICWSLLTVLVISGLLAFVRHLETGRGRDLVCSCLLVFAATYVREIAFLAPPLMLAAGLTLVPPERRRGRLAWALVPHAVIGLAVLVHLAGPGLLRHARPTQAGYGYMKMGKGAGLSHLAHAAVVEIPSRIAAPFGGRASPLRAILNWSFVAITVAGAGLLAARASRFRRAALFPLAFLAVAALPVAGAWSIGGADDRHLIWVIGAWSLLAAMAFSTFGGVWRPIAAAACIAALFQWAALAAVEERRFTRVPLERTVAQVRALAATMGSRDAAVLITDNDTRRETKLIAMAYFDARPHAAVTFLSDPVVVPDRSDTAHWRDRPRVAVIMQDPSCRCWTIRPAGEVIRAWAPGGSGSAQPAPGNAAAEEIVGDQRYILTGKAVHFSGPLEVLVSS